MTRDDYREKCIDAQAKARWALDCRESEDDYRREGRAIPAKWADPWDASGGGFYQQRKYIRDATFIFDSLHGIARLVPVEATEEMIEAGRFKWPDAKIFAAMAARGDLTNPPEKKP